MKQNSAKKEAGLKSLIKQGKQMFRIPENTEHYSAKHYKQAEKKYIKYCVLGGRC